MSEEGKKLFRDLAKQVREKVQPSGEPLLHKRGLDTLEQLATDLADPEGMPGLKVRRDLPTKFRLERPPRNAEIAVEWQRQIGAMVVTMEKHGEPRTVVRYVFDDAANHWRPMDGAGELYKDIAAALVQYLYPEARK